MIVLLTIIASVVAIISSWLYLLRDCKDLNVPGPSPLPVLGNALLFLGKPTNFIPLLKYLKDSYGNVTRVHLLHKRYMILYHPKYVEPLVSRMDLITKGRSYYFLRPWLGDGLLTSEGTRWKIHRKFLTPAFHFNILQNFLPVFQKNEKILIETLKKTVSGPSVDLFPIMALNALDNVTESIMGVSINAQKNSESKYVKSIEALTKIIAMRMRNPFVAEDAIFKLTSYKRIQDEVLKVLHGQTKDVISKRRKELKILNITQLDPQSELGIRNKHAFLDLLLLAETDGQRVSDEHVREEVDTFMFEGHDTTTSGICFALYILSKHPDVQEKILQEQKDILGDDLNRDPTYSELQQMKYLEQVIRESLRIYPSVPLIERLITKDTDIAGIHVKSNTSIIIDIFHMQRNPELFEDPLEFRPERFESHNMKNAFSWMAFSAGPRNCIGQKFALMEMKTTLAGVIKHFKLLPVNKELELCADLILRSENGVHVKFEAR
ncbi:cytochrome P450 4d2-like [Epargyreus clarus]|uniref:cytochrome P450 4d2-like n=1 Tax=Epargyreus clarus TaxID=520877 RepID=UPI003C2ECF17